MTPKAQATKENQQMGLYQTEKLLNSRRNNEQNEKAMYGIWKIFANHISDKGLTSRIYKELNSKNQTNRQNTAIPNMDLGP